MKLKEGFVLRKVAGQIVVIPSGDELDLNMMINLNETGEFLWKLLENGAEEAELVAALLKEYDVTEERALASVRRFVEKLNEHGFLD